MLNRGCHDRLDALTFGKFCAARLNSPWDVTAREIGDKEIFHQFSLNDNQRGVIHHDFAYCIIPDHILACVYRDPCRRRCD